MQEEELRVITKSLK